MREKIKVPGFEDAFRVIEAKDYLGEHKKFLENLDHSLQSQRQTLQTIRHKKEAKLSNTYRFNPRYSKFMGIEAPQQQETSTERLKNRKLSSLEKQKLSLQTHIEKIRSIIFNNPYKSHGPKQQPPQPLLLAQPTPLDLVPHRYPEDPPLLSKVVKKDQ